LFACARRRLDKKTHRMLWSWPSSRKLALIAALSFWMTARSSAIVLAARTLRMNCFTVDADADQPSGTSQASTGEEARLHTGTHLQDTVLSRAVIQRSRRRWTAGSGGEPASRWHL
jgi:hypothetical protein